MQAADDTEAQSQNAPGRGRGDWQIYRHRMVRKVQLKGRSEFLQEKQQSWKRAEDHYSSFRGTSWRRSSALKRSGETGAVSAFWIPSALTFDYKRRARIASGRNSAGFSCFFTEKQHISILLRSMKTSQAPISMGQFMPSSVRKYAASTTRTFRSISLGRALTRSLGGRLTSPEAGWVRGLPPFLLRTPDSDADIRLVTGGITTDLTLTARSGGFIQISSSTSRVTNL